MNKFFRKLKIFPDIARIIIKYEPLYLFYTVPQIIVKSILPFVYLYFPKMIIEQLVNTDLLYNYQDIIWTIIIFGCITLLLNIINIYLKNKSDVCADSFAKKIKSQIGNISMKLELKDIENPNIQDAIAIANRAVELPETMNLVKNIISNIITITGLTYIVVSLDWLFFILLTITLAVKILFVRIQYKNNVETKKMQTENSRYIEYLFNISYYNEGTAKEIRLNNLQEWYMDKTKIYREKMVSIHYKSFKLRAVHNIVIALIMAIQTFVILWLLSKRYLSYSISLADFTLYFSTITTLTISLTSITEQLGNYGQQVFNVSNYNSFLKLSTDDVIKDNASTILNIDNIEIFFDDVSFTYPNTEKQVLKNINIKIFNKEKLVIVGMNGSGKSTFIKLLCKFYHPTSGKITINGIDIWEIPNCEYYNLISAVFQDFINFSFSIKENISMSEVGDLERIMDTSENIGLKERIEKLPKVYNTYLTKVFDSEGIELSGGQTQKLAIARCLYKNTPILILDEPTANLDPRAESEIYEDFFNISKNKTTIFISHRLAVSTLADNIAVFSDGQIIEYGSHNYLMSKNGTYSTMFEKQSNQYLDNKKKIF